jgi:hypothetical protein
MGWRALGTGGCAAPLGATHTQYSAAARHGGGLLSLFEGNAEMISRSRDNF